MGGDVNVPLEVPRLVGTGYLQVRVELEESGRSLPVAGEEEGFVAVAYVTVPLRLRILSMISASAMLLLLPVSIPSNSPCLL